MLPMPSSTASTYSVPVRPLSALDRCLRTIWAVLYVLLFRPSPKPFHAWRCMLLRLFGARIGAAVRVYPTVKIWAPWNLVLADGSTLGYFVDCYNCGMVELKERAMVSQYTILCTGTHDYHLRALPLITKPIVVEREGWVCADAFIGPGVTVGEGAVVGARSCVFRDVPAWTVVAGNPARFIKRREIWD